MYMNESKQKQHTEDCGLQKLQIIELVKFTGPTMTMSVPMTPVWGQTGNFYWAEEM